MRTSLTLLFLSLSGCSLDAEGLANFRQAAPPGDVDVAGEQIPREVDRHLDAGPALANDATVPADALGLLPEAPGLDAGSPQADVLAVAATDAGSYEEPGCGTGSGKPVAEGEFCIVLNRDPAVDRYSWPGACRRGNCCVGCWDGARCRSGTEAPLCGTAGGTCRESKCLP